MSNCAARFKGLDTSFQWIKSVEWWICTPGYHSKVDVAMK